MSVFIKPRLARIINTSTRTIKRNIISNPALNTNPAFRNPAIVPFGVNFIDDSLRECLLARGVDCDELEKLYYQQCQDDAEFNSSRLPRSYDSKLWGFIYGQRLISAKYQLDTITKDEKFLTNYLNETITELTMRMNRFYPNFDYKSQVNACKKTPQVDNPAYNNAYNEALADIISTNPHKFISIFKNNSFIPVECDTDPPKMDDKYNDYLPEQVETELIANYQYEWDFNRNLQEFEAYFSRIQKLEHILSPKIDALSSNLRKNFADFLLDSFNKNNLNNIKYVITLVENATTNIISDLEAISPDILVTNSLNILAEMSTSGELISKLFYGNNGVRDSKLSHKNGDELTAILSTCDGERLLLINKSLEIYQYLKYNSMTRLILTCIMHEYGDYFAQFLNGHNGEDNIENFEEINNEILDQISSFQAIYYENQQDLSDAFNSLCKVIESECGEVRLDLNAFTAPPCWISAMLTSCIESARMNGDILGEIKYATFLKYVIGNSSNMGVIALIKGIMNGGKGNVNGDEFSKLAYEFATNASGGNEILLGQIESYMRDNALVCNKSELGSVLGSQLENFRSVAVRYNESRCNLENAIKEVRIDFNSINFEHAKSNYDPLSTYLAQFRYYNNR